MKISHYLQKENNNLDLLRFILAFLVLYGHADHLNRGSGSGYMDPLLDFYQDSSLGDMAVKIFFFLSGLLITQSWLRKPEVLSYLFARVFRIMPPLVFVLVVTTFIVGPFFTVLPLRDYFGDSSTWAYLWKGTFLKIQYTLPGVFEGAAVNGSLWTLPWEFRFYLLLLAFLLLLGQKQVKWVNAVLALFLVESVLGQQVVLGAFGELSITNLLPVSFFFGVFLAFNADRIQLDYKPVLALFILFVLFRSQPFGELVFTLFFCMGALWCSSWKGVMRFRPKHDLSYGLYLWAFLVQQALYAYWGNVQIWVHIGLALVLSSALAYLTRVLIEVPFMRLGRRLSHLANDLQARHHDADHHPVDGDQRVREPQVHQL